jgi:hypothetical protein
MSCQLSVVRRNAVSESPPGFQSAAEEVGRNGSPSPSETPEQPAEPKAADGSAVDRADEMVDEVARRVAAVTRQIGKGFLRFLARAREECSDVWAEAQDIRRGEKR